MNSDSRGHPTRGLAMGVFALGMCLVAFEASAAVIVPAGPPWAITVTASDPISGGGSTVIASVSPSASLVQTLTATMATRPRASTS